MQVFRTQMPKGVPSARSRAWQIKIAAENGSDVFPPFLAENHPSDRAFNTLATILQAAMVIAHSEHSQTSSLLYSAFIWAKDCFEWHQEAAQGRDTVHQMLKAKQLEFEAINSELVQRRDEITLFQQQLSQHAHRHIRVIQAKQDGDLDHFKSVAISLQAQLTRREENVADLRRANTKLKQEIFQARTDMEQALEIATNQLDAEVQRLEHSVRAQAACTRVRVLPALRSSPARVFKAWVERAVFQCKQRMVARCRELDLTFCSLRSWMQAVFLPKTARCSRAYSLTLQKRNALLSWKFHSWVKVVRKEVRFVAMLAPYKSALATAQKQMAFRDWITGTRKGCKEFRFKSMLAMAQTQLAFQDWTRATFNLTPYRTLQEDSQFVVPNSAQLPAVPRGVSHAEGFKGGGRF